MDDLNEIDARENEEYWQKRDRSRLAEIEEQIDALESDYCNEPGAMPDVYILLVSERNTLRARMRDADERPA